MKNFHNIETVKNSDGTRTAYDATGRSWRIRGSTGNWTARASHTVQGLVNVLVGFDRLAEISRELEQIK